MISRTRDANQNQMSSSNPRTVEQEQSAPSPSAVMSNLPTPSSFEPWFPLPHFSYKPEFDLACIPDLRRLALKSNLSSLIISQIDYYFRDANLVKDEYLRSHMDNQGWVDVFVIAEFSRIKRMTNDIELILRSMRSSTTVEVQGYKLRKRQGWERWIIPRGGSYRYH